MQRTELQERFDRVPGNNCFACSPRSQNPHGLHLTFEETEKGARTRFELPLDFQSYPGILHGGILSTVLDETMFYAAAFKLKVIGLTRKMEVSFRNAARPGVAYDCEADLLEQTPALFRASARIRGGGVGIVVRATAEFTIPTAAVASRIMGQEAVDTLPDFFCAHHQPGT